MASVRVPTCSSHADWENLTSASCSRDLGQDCHCKIGSVGRTSNSSSAESRPKKKASAQASLLMRSLMTGSAVTYTAWEVAMTTVPEADIAFRTRSAPQSATPPAAHAVPQVPLQAAGRAATRRSSLELAVSLSAVRTARHWAASVLADSRTPRELEVVDIVVLLVSELVTNAIAAASKTRATAKPRVWLSIVRSGEVVRLEVHDSAQVAVPAICHRNGEEESGRGLEVISALAAAWGWQPEPCGKVVWCELAV
jgi:anti-sigma regulatory factor (Ser/Thr protein kinase)